MSGIAAVPSKRPTDRFNDIIYNVDAINRYTDGMSEEQFLTDKKTIDAVERCLSRISEASTKLGSLVIRLAPDQPWSAIRGLGNRLRHEYDLVNKSELWNIIVNDLSSLRSSCEQAILRIHQGLDRDPQPKE